MLALLCNMSSGTLYAVKVGVTRYTYLPSFANCQKSDFVQLIQEIASACKIRFFQLGNFLCREVRCRCQGFLSGSGEGVGGYRLYSKGNSSSSRSSLRCILYMPSPTSVCIYSGLFSSFFVVFLTVSGFSSSSIALQPSRLEASRSA